ncbi:flagellar biosynthesis protein FlgA [Paenibacillus nanensis]|uniref:Flagellar biosynthesis protein FlgA n=1 Tax=Paenibacillus nanensis TaxID=393251 RepID=A0A3A1UWX0_9BACL|nr:flagellar biosynthesis protein FlgA [Paenibacillus nanensis]RIX50823.1 flagellar biosynthesis protein FlgA [Paenibacillus nanensis]
MDLSTLKNTKPNRNLFKKVLAFVFALLVVVSSYLYLDNASRKAENVVQVIRVKSNDGIPAFAPLTSKNIETYNLIEKEYTEDMILAEDMDNVTDQLTKYYLRKGSILYKDQLTDEKPLKNEWLYEVADENEVLTLPYNFLEVGGDILMPGDRVRIRVSYDREKNVSTASGNPNMPASTDTVTVRETEVLFDSIVIKDMLNSNSRSIYEVYKEVQKLDEDKRQEVMKSEEFIDSIKPKALLLEGSSEQINNFAKYQGFENQSFLITILSRKNSSIILDQLPTLEKEVESWIDDQQK